MNIFKELDFKVILLIWGIILSLLVFAYTMISLGVIWLKSGVNKKTEKLDTDDGRKKVSDPSFGLVLAIKVLATFFILVGSYRLSWEIYLRRNPQYISDIDALSVLVCFLSVILCVWPCILGFSSFRMFRWSRVCILWLLFIELFWAIWENSVIIYWYLGGWTAGSSFYLAPVIYLILAPLLLIGFYSHKKVKAAFESKDPYVRWNDKHPYLLWLINIVVGLIVFILIVPDDIRSIVRANAFRADIPPEHSKIDFEIPQEPKVPVDVQRESASNSDAIRNLLQPGMQLYTINKSNAEVGDGEMLEPGCLVDVFVELPQESLTGNREDETLSKALLKKVQVIAVNGEFDKPIPLDEEGKIPNSSTCYWKELIVTLLVETKQAEQLQLASKQGDIKLVRHPLDQSLKNTTDAESTQIDDTDK